MVIMKNFVVPSGLHARAMAASLAVVASCAAIAQNTAQEKASQAAAAAPAESATTAWAFGAPVPGNGGWTAERGTMTVATGKASLQRVRVQARRDARGGWITIADASGTALRDSTGGYAVKRRPGARDTAIERLRIELQFRTTNPRVLTRIAAR